MLFFVLKDNTEFHEHVIKVDTILLHNKALLVCLGYFIEQAKQICIVPTSSENLHKPGSS